MNFEEFLIERKLNSCNEIVKAFKFSGTNSDNRLAMDFVYNLLNEKTSCEDMLLLYCCIEEHIKRNFCKSNNYTRINDEDKLKICGKLKQMTPIMKKFTLRNSCGIPDCTKII